MLRRSIVSLCLVVCLAVLAACQPEPLPVTEAAQAPATEAAVMTEALPPANGAMECAWAGNGATIALGDKRLNFDCGGTDTYVLGLFGEVTQGDKGWEITQAQANTTTNPVTATDEKTVLVTHIILEDGTNCAFAGTGATTGIEGKRLNFTCGGGDDYTVGLFGDITLGDKGWEITQAQIKNDPANPNPQNVITVIIAKLGVEPE